MKDSRVPYYRATIGRILVFHIIVFSPRQYYRDLNTSLADVGGFDTLPDFNTYPMALLTSILTCNHNYHINRSFK